MLSSASLLILAIFSVGYNHPDEHFQILEFAALKLHLTKPENLPWEFHNMMRPTLQPAIVVLVHKIFALFGCTSPFAITVFLRILTGALSFVSMRMIYRHYSKEFADPLLQKYFLFLSFLLWFALYNNVRYCSETWSALFFIIGFSYLYCLSRKPLKADFLITGLLLGLSFVFRYQAGFFIAGFLAWFAIVRKERLIHLVYMMSGILLIIMAGIITDRWFYGEWVLTTWNYFQQNIVADKLSGFGILPWYFYFVDIFGRAMPPFSLVFMLSFLLFFIFRPKDLLTWTLLPFILIHFAIGHKESRFFFPLIGFIPVILIKSIELVRDKWYPALFGNKLFRFFVKFFAISNMLLIVITFFNPADSLVRLYQVIYTKYNYPVTLYYLAEDPYHRALKVYYYKRDNLLLKKASSAVQLNADSITKFLVASKTGNKTLDSIHNKRLIWSSHPEWIKLFDFYNWVERTPFWNVYEVDRLKNSGSKD